MWFGGGDVPTGRQSRSHQLGIVRQAPSSRTSALLRGCWLTLSRPTLIALFIAYLISVKSLKEIQSLRLIYIYNRNASVQTSRSLLKPQEL
jgi:hypothetical protein